MREKNQNREEELLFIKDWCLTIVEYLDSISGTNYIHIFRRGITKGYEEKNLRGMRLALKDSTQMALDMNSQNIDKLNILLKEKFGKDLYDQSGKTQKEINKIIKRGKILNSDEFRLLKEKIEEIYSEVQPEELEKLNNLLLEYEQEIPANSSD